MPVKLPFTVAGCSGEDPEFPVTELLYHSPDSKGWCTPRFSQYPQELTLRLEQPARLAQIQLLSHEFKIAGKVELLVGTLEHPVGAGAGSAGAAATLDPSKAAWRRLGFLSFDSNERSNFTARELKSVALNGTPAHLLRLVFHRCHANSANVYGQVSLVAISLLGDPMGPVPLAPITNTGPYVPTGGGVMPGSMLSPSMMAPPLQQPQYGAPPPPMAQQYGMPPSQPFQHQFGMAQPPMSQQQQQQYAPPAAAAALLNPADAAAALAAELGVDTVTAQRIRDLQLQKQQAVEREDYDEAKRLKAAVDRLRAAGGAIAQLEARKRTAVEEEDYDLAKQLKVEIERMRNSVYAAALAGSNLPDAGPSPPYSRRTSAVAAGPAADATAPASRPSADGGSRSGGSLQEEPSSQRGPAGAAAAGSDAATPQRRQQAAVSGSTDWGSYDERPAQAKGAYSFQNADETSLPTTNRRSTMPGGTAAGRASSSAKANDAGPAPPGFPADLPAPEALSAADAKDAGPLADVVGEYLAHCMFSRTWQLREAALTRLAQDLEGHKLERMEGGSADSLKTVARLLQRTIKDKVAAVFSASLGALRALVAAQAGNCSARDLQAAVGELLPLLVEKAADLNQRTKEQATEALVTLAGVPEAGLSSSTGPFLRLPKPNTAWKVVLGRLQLVSALLPIIGMAGRSGDGFQLESLMDFINPAFSNSSAEVRGAAVALTLQVAQLAGPSVQRLLPPDLNSKVKEQIEQGLLNPTAALASGPAAKPSPASARGVAPARAKPPPPAAAAAAAAAPPSSRQPGAPQQAAAAAAAPRQQQQQGPPPVAAPPPSQQQQQAVPPPPAAAAAAAAAVPDADDDPAVYEAQVREREARLGAGHPDVAEAICNLAIVHNQRGNVAAALPLYEQALAIWEVACGPDSPDVAHTLTDIAVIHLEQGRDDIGRPLLQRALAIQEAHLGPDHPDVMAIRDVLMEEEEG